MKKILFLLLFPAFAMAQYQGNGNQKITLGEQTSADGLVWRGVASIDTVTATSKITRTNKQDTSTYILLDTVTNLLWHYKTASNGWIQAGGSTLDTATMLLPYWRSGRFSGVLPVVNGGTGSATQNFVDLTTTQSIGGAKTFTSAVTATRFNPTSSTATGTGMFLPAANTLGFSTNGTQKLTIQSNGNVGIGTTSPISILNIQDGSLYIGSSQNISQTQNILFTYGYNFSGTPLGVSKITSTYNNNNSSASLEFYTSPPNGNPIERLFISSTGEIGLGVNIPTSVLQIKAGTTSSNTAPLKFTSGSLMNNAESGAMEFNGTNLFFSPSTTRHTVNHGLTGSATLDFPSTTTLLSADLTITVTGVSDGDVVSIGVPNAAVNANTCYTAWVSAANTVTVRFNNYSSGTVDPASGLFKVFVTK